MNNNDFEKVLDSLLDDASQKADTNIGNLLSESDADISFSQEHLKKMNKIFKKEQRKKNLVNFKRATKLVACFLAVIVLTSSIAIFSVEAWRNMFLNYVFDSSNPNTDFSFSSTNGTTFSDENINIAYIPSGYEVIDKFASRSTISYEFKNNDDYFVITIQDINNKKNIDTEDGTIEKLTINGNDSVLISNPDVKILLWHNNTSAFTIYGNIDKETLIKIAENIL